MSKRTIDDSIKFLTRTDSIPNKIIVKDDIIFVCNLSGLIGIILFYSYIC